MPCAGWSATNSERKLFLKWLAQKKKASAARRADPVAEKIVEALAGYAGDRDLGNYGYTVRRARGKGVSGFVAVKNTKKP